MDGLDTSVHGESVRPRAYLDESHHEVISEARFEAVEGGGAPCPLPAATAPLG